jgi:cysteinyl-tRNA synthetase
MVDNKKMAKSAGNFITLQNINEQGYSSLVYRYLLLQTHHRKQFNFNNKESIMAAQFGLDHLYEKAWHLSLTNTKTESSDQNIEQEFIEYLNKDLGTPQAFALVQDAITNSQISYSLLKKLDEAILGLEIEKGVDNYNQKWKKDLEEIQMPPEIKEIRTKRDQARAQKDFIKSDELRKQLEDLGYEVEDTKEGTKLHKK